MKTALITGGTDGIGAALAISLARQGYAVHVTGRNQNRADALMAELGTIAPDLPHRSYLFDLSSPEDTKSFARSYAAETESLNVLVLNANAFDGPAELTPAGIEKTFAVGYLSRFVLSVELDALLEQSGGQVIHLGVASMAAKLNFDRITQDGYGQMKATAQAYAADSLLAYFHGKETRSKVPHSMYDPGVVNTRQVQQLNVLLRTLARIMGLYEPTEAGEILARHIIDTANQNPDGKNFKAGKPSKVSKAVRTGKGTFEQLMALSAELSGLSAPQTTGG